MPPEAIEAGALPLASLRIPAAWRRPLAWLAAAWALVFVLFASDWRDMAGQWWDSSTYNHILLVPPIVAWLVSLRAGEVVQLTPHGWWPGLVLFAGAAFLWMLGDFAGFSLVRQVAVVVMLQASVVALAGPAVAGTLLFPMAYLLFLVPFGDELIPVLQTVTARIVMIMLGLAQVRAQLDGVFISTDFGYFKVAEACSGVKFLIAMTAYGTLVANVCFRGVARRVAFMALALAVPILANGLRAWGTIVIARERGIQFASGFDHVFYGWIFFAVVMVLVMLAGWRFFDRAIDDRMVDAQAIAHSPLVMALSRFRLGEGRVFMALAALALAFIGWGTAANRLAADLPQHVGFPQVAGWQRIDTAPLWPWQPLHAGADHRLRARYADGAGHVVDVSFALYAAQGDGREAGGFGQGAQPLGSHWAWEKPGPAFDRAKSDILQAPGPIHRLALTWYRTDGVLTGSNMTLKLANIRDRLLLRPRATATLALSAEDVPGHSAEAAVRAFAVAIGPVDGWIDRVARGG